MRNRLGKNPSYGRINRGQANSQLQVSHVADLQQSVKIKNSQNSGLGVYYKNGRPSHNINSFQLRNSVGPRNNPIVGSSGRGLGGNAGNPQGMPTNVNSQPELRLQ